MNRRSKDEIYLVASKLDCKSLGRFAQTCRRMREACERSWKDRAGVKKNKGFDSNTSWSEICRDHTKYDDENIIDCVRNNQLWSVKCCIRLHQPVNSVDSKGNSALYYACGGGRYISQLLLEKGAIPDFPNHCGTTPLHVACAQQNGPLIKLLLDFGANPDCTNDRGRKPINYIRNQKIAKQVVLLLL